MNIMCENYLVQIWYPRKIDHQLWTTYTKICTPDTGRIISAFRSFGRSRREASGSAYFHAKQEILMLPTNGPGQ